MALILMILALAVLGFVFPPFWAAALALLLVGLFKPALFKKPLSGKPNPDLKGWNDK